MSAEPFNRSCVVVPTPFPAVAVPLVEESYEACSVDEGAIFRAVRDRMREAGLLPSLQEREGLWWMEEADLADFMDACDRAFPLGADIEGPSGGTMERMREAGDISGLLHDADALVVAKVEMAVTGARQGPLDALIGRAV